MKRYIVLLTALVISHFAMAQDFKPMEHFCNDVKGKIPLVIYLHGRHASGNDNQKQLSQAGVQEIDKYLRKNAIPAYFLVPQCPEDYEWDGRNGNSGYTDKVVDLITFYLKTKDIDMNRIYICGASMGACGTWKILKDNPKLFAAALIASGQAQHEKPSDYTDTPLYVTVGSEERSYNALKWLTTEIRKAGGNVKFDVLFGQKHRRKIKYATIFFICWFAILVFLVDGVLKFQTLVDYFGSYALVEIILLLLVILPTWAVYKFTKDK